MKDLVEKAAAGEYVYYQTVKDRPGFYEWAAEVEDTLFPAEDAERNALLQLHLHSVPSATEEVPVEENTALLVTLGIPTAHQAEAEVLLSKYGLRTGQEGSGVAVLTSGNADSPVSVVLQLDPSKIPAAHLEKLGDFSVTSLRGKNIFQLSGKSQEEDV